MVFAGSPALLSRRLTRLAMVVAAGTLALSSACTPAPGPAPDPGDRAPCGYPDAIEPMTEDEAMAAYKWNVGKLSDGTDVEVDLAAAHCDTSDTIDWSPFDVLLFVSIPAW